MKFKKKPIVIEATQWFKNGDHPEDGDEMVYPDRDSTTQFEPFLGEGKVVNHCRHPFVLGTTICERCQRMYADHGWIDTLEGGHIVCPGDWVITGIMGEHYPCKPDIFKKTYESVEETE